jgi:SpoVK/Ycf46/Vps4 family AAA+-type ATPase
MPGVEERERIWHVQIHPAKTPLADDVDFRALAEQFAVSGGDIKNAVLKAAAAAAAEPGHDSAKRIHQRHFASAMEEVIAAKAVMQQSVYGAEADARDERLVEAIQAAEARWRATALGAAALAGAAMLVAVGAIVTALLR